MEWRAIHVLVLLPSLLVHPSYMGCPVVQSLSHLLDLPLKSPYSFSQTINLDFHDSAADVASRPGDHRGDDERLHDCLEHQLSFLLFRNETLMCLLDRTLSSR